MTLLTSQKLAPTPSDSTSRSDYWQRDALLIGRSFWTLSRNTPAFILHIHSPQHRVVTTLISAALLSTKYSHMSVVSREIHTIQCCCNVFTVGGGGSVVRMSVFDWRTFLNLCLVYSWHVTTSWVRCPLWVNRPGQLSLPSLRGRLMSSNPCNYTDYGGEDH